MQPEGLIIRKCRIDEVDFLAEIEKEASKLFSDYGLEAGALADATLKEEFVQAAEQGLLWVAVISGKIIGFALVLIIEGQPLLAELDVLPQFGKRGIGTKLLNEVISWAKFKKYSIITLTTFKNIPWNYPFYKKMGFMVLPENLYTSGINKLVEHEHSRGLYQEERCVMQMKIL
jgi:GNAT superfamily N-acetyltransferase